MNEERKEYLQELYDQNKKYLIKLRFYECETTVTLEELIQMIRGVLI